MRRTNDDKRRAVTVLLTDDEWQKWLDNKIARQCGVSQPFVSAVRKELSSNGYKMPEDRLAERGGTVYEQDTTNIGGSAPEVRPSSEPAPTCHHPSIARAIQIRIH